ncbi:MAG: TrmH family RNA methyltransferase, partial [Methanomassiliicoccales archaeon]
MVNFRVVLVEPQTDGNVGAVARSMGNFGFNELCMVSPCEIT